MDELAIKRHNFEQAKNRLKEFSEKTEAELKIKEVKEDGGFLGLGDHKVTGSEFNKRLETLVRNLYDDLVMNHARRVINMANPGREELSTIKAEDFNV